MGAAASVDHRKQFQAEQAKPRDATDITSLEQGVDQVRRLRHFFTQFEDDAGQEELSKPADASDIGTLAAAVTEISRLRWKFGDAGFDEQRMLFSLWRLFKELARGSGKVSHAGFARALAADYLLAADVACRAPGLADSDHWLKDVGFAHGPGYLSFDEMMVYYYLHKLCCVDEGMAPLERVGHGELLAALERHNRDFPPHLRTAPAFADGALFRKAQGCDEQGRLSMRQLYTLFDRVDEETGWHLDALQRAK